MTNECERCQKVVFSIDNYRWRKTDDEARQLMWQDISQFFQLLLKNEYMFVLYEDSADIVVIQYNYSINSGLSDYVPRWITDDELYFLEDSKTVSFDTDPSSSDS